MLQRDPENTPARFVVFCSVTCKGDEVQMWPSNDARSRIDTMMTLRRVAASARVAYFFSCGLLPLAGRMAAVPGPQLGKGFC